MRRVCLSSSSTYIATLSVFCCSMASRRGLSHRQECGNHVYRYAEFEKIRKWLNLGNRLVLTKLKWPQNLLYFLSSYSSYFLLVLYLTPSSTNAYTFPSLHSSYFIPLSIPSSKSSTMNLTASCASSWYFPCPLTRMLKGSWVPCE